MEQQEKNVVTEIFLTDSSNTCSNILGRPLNRLKKLEIDKLKGNEWLRKGAKLF